MTKSMRTIDNYSQIIISYVIYLLSIIRLSQILKAVRSYRSTVVECTHWLVATIARDPDVIVFNDILFDECLSCLLPLALSNSCLVNICLW